MNVTGMDYSSAKAIAISTKLFSASQDASGLAISEGLAADIVGLGATIENAQDGRNAINVMDGAHSSMASNLRKIHGLTLRSMNGTMGAVERSYIQKEIEMLVSEHDRIAKSTNVNGYSVLDGSNDSMSLALSPDGSGTEITLFDATAKGLGIENYDVTGDFDLDDILDAMSKVSLIRGEHGATSNRLDYTIDNNSTTALASIASKSRISDADMAEEIMNYSRETLMESLRIIMQKQMMEQKKSTQSLSE